MTTEGLRQKLTAILSADVKDYSRLMNQDRIGTIEALNSHRKLFSGFVTRYIGRVIDTPGDNILAEFDSVSDAVNCAVEIQREIAERNADVTSSRMMQWRIGVNLGDVVEEEDRIYGDGVNIAARIEGLAEPGGICISGTVYDQIHGKLGLEYESLGEQQVKNITEPVRVYRVLSPSSISAPIKGDPKRIFQRAVFAVATVVLLCVGLAVGWNYVLRTKIPSEQDVKTETAIAPAEKPSIAVLPFDNMSRDPEQEYFADGITEEIITKLSKSQQLFVIARNSTFTYKGKPVKIQQVSRELGARYVVEGSVRKAGNSMRVTVQMIDAHTGNHIWSETYDRKYNINELINIQDEISEQIGGAVLAGYKKSEVQRVKRLPTDNLNAYDTYWRALDYFNRGTEESVIEARKLLEHAIDIDPEFAEAYALLSDIFQISYWAGWLVNPQEAIKQAVTLAQKAIAIDDANARGHGVLAGIYVVTGKTNQAFAEAGRAISVEPNNAYAHNAMSNILRDIGKYKEAIESAEKAMRLNPNYPPDYDNSLARTYVQLGRYEEAIRLYNESLSKNRNFIEGYQFLSMTFIFSWVTQQSYSPQYLDRALENSKKAVALNDKGAGVNVILGIAYLYNKQYPQALAQGKKAIELSPDEPLIIGPMAIILNYTDNPEEAIELMDKTDYLKTTSWGTALLLLELGHAHSLIGHYEEAISTLLRGFEYHPSFHAVFRGRLYLITSYIALGREAEARAQAAEVLKMVPNFSVEVWGHREPYQDQEIIKRYMAAFRKAGLK